MLIIFRSSFNIPDQCTESDKNFVMNCGELIPKVETDKTIRWNLEMLRISIDVANTVE